MEIIPNWHPIFVHFTVALLPVAVAFFLLSAVIAGKYQEQWLTAGRWTLWLGAAFSLVTVASGIFAYNTVDHDAPSHAAMTIHRNYALVTLVLYISSAVWSYLGFRKGNRPGAPLLIFLIVSFIALAGTAWRGGELVYRHGLGVMALPKSEGHEHNHGAGHEHEHGPAPEQGAEPEHEPASGLAREPESEHEHEDGHGHEHEHDHEHEDGHEHEHEHDHDHEHEHEDGHEHNDAPAMPEH